MRILLTGANGQLGQAIRQLCPPQYSLFALDSKVLDIRDKLACSNKVQSFKPDWIINAAAYTNVEQAELEPNVALAINRDGVANLALVAKASNVRLLHISTDFVFNGKATNPYKPDAATAPLNQYGHSKLEGELAIREILGREALVIRTAWLYDSSSKNFVNTMLKLMAEQPFLRIIADQHGTPTNALSLAKAVFKAIECDIRGFHHWTDGGEATWHDFAITIQALALKYGILKSEKEIQAVSSKEFQTRAIRPAYSVLDKSSFTGETGLSPCLWQETLEETIKAKGDQ